MSNRRSTLLTDYIRREFRNYEEPERAGKAKGDLIGFSKPKFLAVLLHLVSLNGIEISQICHVPINTFRVWRTEPPFKTAVNSRIEQFAHVCVEKLIEAGRVFKENNMFQETSIEDAATGSAGNKRPDFHKIFDEALYPFSDIVIFSDQLMDAIFKVSNAALRQHQVDGKSQSVVDVLTPALPPVFFLRKGLFSPTDDEEGNWEFVIMNPVDSENRKRITILEYAEAFQKPWTAPKERILTAKTLFQERLRDIQP